MTQITNEAIYELLKTQGDMLKMQSKRFDSVEKRIDGVDNRLADIKEEIRDVKIEQRDFRRRMDMVETKINGIHISWNNKLIAGVLGTSAVASALVAVLVRFFFLTLPSMGKPETDSRTSPLREAKDRHYLKQLMLATIASVGIGMGSSALAESDETVDNFPLQAIPEYSENIEGWKELYQAQIDGSMDYRQALRLFLTLRVADLGYGDPKEVPRELRTAIRSDYNDWQGLAGELMSKEAKEQIDKDTDEFLADLASNN